MFKYLSVITAISATSIAPTFATDQPDDNPQQRRPSLSQAASDLTYAAKKEFDNTEKEVRPVIKEAAHDTQDALKNTEKEVRPVIKDAVHDTQDALKTVEQDVRPVVKEVVNEAKIGLNKAKKKLKKWK